MRRPLRVAFFGTPPVAVPSLEALAVADDVEVVAVVTNPDRPRGRSGRPVAPPVKVAAEQRGLPLLQPTRPVEVADRLGALELDAVAVVAYGSILPERLLAVAEQRYVNLHFSLLPRWRGAAPVQHALRAGDRTTGVTTFVLDAGMDTGPILDQVTVQVAADETAGELAERLAVIGAPVLVRGLRRLCDGATPTPQPEVGVTYAPKVRPEDVAIDWESPARTIVDLVRAANPSPGAHTVFRGERLKVWRARTTEGAGVPGELLWAEGTGPVVAARDGAVVLVEVQPAGRARMDARAFVNVYRPQPGERLGA
ncbi:MAG TPA: methionyl-tRNA formyltransferase [Nitriliruptorales bacterium]|nr:methionyl-tRNA formyltransferase [Nitriliruptorales bacterium]